MTLHKLFTVNKGKAKAKNNNDDDDQNNSEDNDESGTDEHKDEEAAKDQKPTSRKKSVSNIKADAKAKAQLNQKIFLCLFSPFHTTEGPATNTSHATNIHHKEVDDATPHDADVDETMDDMSD
ncbi:hypothetical protein JVT61DRAFT_3724 [Boletus reticuloceps]|uniref:Uncharacterized protein n=1 Tax=Boletus reticuloceps TaxID=495285 RepID=A0A8I2YLJ6_9AGAM|nr:hypothetical protein JVT61DRAFT_3724 [Boletus reticuloceps]